MSGLGLFQSVKALKNFCICSFRASILARRLALSQLGQVKACSSCYSGLYAKEILPNAYIFLAYSYSSYLYATKPRA